jgi:molybdopterin biosynthesis enzyme MoaB
MDNLDWEQFQDLINDEEEDQYMKIVMEQLQQQRVSVRSRTYIERNREEGHARLFNDYFSDNPVYTEEQFR